MCHDAYSVQLWHEHKARSVCGMREEDRETGAKMGAGGGSGGDMCIEMIASVAMTTTEKPAMA